MADVSGISLASVVPTLTSVTSVLAERRGVNDPGRSHAAAGIQVEKAVPGENLRRSGVLEPDVIEGEVPRQGSMTLVAAVSPAGGDFSEPVTQTSLRVAGGFWGLDAALAYRRHYPAINWKVSYTLYLETLKPWFRDNAPKGWLENRQRAMDLLQRDAEMQEIVQLVGPDALQDGERLILETGKMVREVFLQQNAFSDNDAFSSLEKTGGLLETLLEFYDLSKNAIENGVTLNRLMGLAVREDIARLRNESNADFADKRATVCAKMRTDVAAAATKKG